MLRRVLTPPAQLPVPRLQKYYFLSILPGTELVIISLVSQYANSFLTAGTSQIIVDNIINSNVTNHVEHTLNTHTTQSLIKIKSILLVVPLSIYS